MSWATFQKIPKRPKWEKAAGFTPVLRATNPNPPQFRSFSGLQWEVFHRRLIALSHLSLSQYQFQNHLLAFSKQALLSPNHLDTLPIGKNLTYQGHHILPT